MYTKFSVLKKIFLSVGIFTATQNAYASELKGTVKNSVTGEKIQNVSVTNQNFGVVTDLNGFFILKNLEEKDCELKFSYVGFATKTLKLKPGENSFIILLEPEKQNIDEVFVTDSRAKQNETPVTFSNFSNENIEKKYTVQDLPILVSELPSVNFYSETGTGLGASYLSIRGFDQKRIAVTVNGVPQNDPEDHNVYWYDFTDLASNLQDVQIQRGAGNTSYGHAAIGGSVNLETKKYSTETKLALQGGLGSFGTKKLALSYDSGLINNSYALSGKFSKTVT
ncbi:TonB-dependent receptor plug domain-containing protein, partial [bacterium]|nr:TonB-dependent receptor plug domain-containing protein [bacterium]